MRWCGATCGRRRRPSTQVVAVSRWRATRPVGGPAGQPPFLNGAVLIENPVSIAPGFSIGNVHVMAGVPAVFEAMVASVLPRITGGTPLLSQSLRIMRGEGEIAAPLAALAADFPDLSFGSYPFNRDGVFGANVVVRGTDGPRVAEATARLAGLFPG